MSDGLYLGVGDGCHAVWGPIIAASRKEESAARRLCVAGEEEPVELDDAGQPVEAKADASADRWVIRGRDGLFWDAVRRVWGERSIATQFTAYERDRVIADRAFFMPRDCEWVDLAAAPAIAQPSPYSDSADQPIPYKITEPDKTKRDRLIAEIAVHYAKASRHVRMASKKSRKLERLDAKNDSAKARLRGGK